MQAGDIVLHEEERLTSESKIYIVESGRIDCYKTFEARACTRNVLASNGEGLFLGDAREPETIFACVDACHFKNVFHSCLCANLHITPETLFSITFHWMMASKATSDS